MRFGLGCVLAVAVLPVVALPAAAGGTPDPAGSTRRTTPLTVDVPAYADTQRLEARVPEGDLVTYRLPQLPAGGTRLMGDWNGDDVETPGTFVNGTWQLSDQVVRTAADRPAVTFGQAGDRPVTGDWNGDGVTDLGVVRGNEWLLTLGPVPTDGSPPVVWRDVTFGAATGVPVTGDWDGDGITGPGMVTGRDWLLAPTADNLAAATSVTYGSPGDLPVVGDWDGDGDDGIGVVRRSTWYLSNTTVRPRAAVTSRLERRRGDAPLAWQVPVSPGGATCPTRSPTATRGNARWVVPSPLLDRRVTPLSDHTARQVRASLEQSERYLLGTRYRTQWRATRLQSFVGLLGGKNDELAIRLPAMSALTVAVGLRTGAYDSAVVGRTTGRAVGYVKQLVRSIACQHVALTPGGWGRGWETAHWAMLTGAAAWLMWDRLTPDTRSDVVAMMVAEADRQAQLAVPYWALPDGTVVSPGDTKAEECAWNAGLLSLAAAMMPSAPHAALWRAKSAELAVAAYSVPQDLTSSTPVNGVSLANRLDGYNAYAEGIVENHQRIHPDYAANIQLLWLSADFDRLARQRVPEAMFHDGGLVYSALSTHSFVAGEPSPAGPPGATYAAPGGTSYVPGTNTVYYPQGDDWGTVRRAHFVSLDAHALVYGKYLGATGWPAAEALLQHEHGQRALVASSGTDDGRTYSADPLVAHKQDTYPGREEYAAQSLASAWLALYVQQIGVPLLDRGPLAVPGATAKAPRAPAAATTLAP